MPVTPTQFRRMALALPGAIEASHMGHPDFRIGGKIFATLSAEAEVRGMVKLAPPDQHAFLRVEPRVYQPASGAWGRSGCTMLRLKQAKLPSVRRAIAAAFENVATKRESTAKPSPRKARAAQRFSAPLLAALRDGKYLGIRAGSEHKFIGIWVVVVQDRVFVRSWSLKPRSWYRTFRDDPRGTIVVGKREVPVRASFARGQRLLDAIDAAYLAKYDTRSALVYSRGLAEPKRRASTTEISPC